MSSFPIHDDRHVYLLLIRKQRMRQEEEGGGEYRDDISPKMCFQEFLFPRGPKFLESCRVSNIQILIYRDTPYSNHSINPGAKLVVSIMRWPICYNMIIEKLKNSGDKEEKRKPCALVQDCNLAPSPLQAAQRFSKIQNETNMGFVSYSGIERSACFCSLKHYSQQFWLPKCPEINEKLSKCP